MRRGGAVDVNVSRLPAAQQARVRQHARDAGIRVGTDFRTPDAPHFDLPPPDLAQAIRDLRTHSASGTPIRA